MKLRFYIVTGSLIYTIVLGNGKWYYTSVDFALIFALKHAICEWVEEFVVCDVRL